jgi:hypothetical protein
MADSGEWDILDMLRLGELNALKRERPGLETPPWATCAMPLSGLQQDVTG